MFISNRHSYCLHSKQVESSYLLKKKKKNSKKKKKRKKKVMEILGMLLSIAYGFACSIPGR